MLIFYTSDVKTMQQIAREEVQQEPLVFSARLQIKQRLPAVHFLEQHQQHLKQIHLVPKLLNHYLERKQLLQDLAQPRQVHLVHKGLPHLEQVHQPVEDFSAQNNQRHLVSQQARPALALLLKILQYQALLVAFLDSLNLLE